MRCNFPLDMDVRVDLLKPLNGLIPGPRMVRLPRHEMKGDLRRNGSRGRPEPALSEAEGCRPEFLAVREGEIAQERRGKNPGYPWRIARKRRGRRNGGGGMKALHARSKEVKSGRPECFCFQNVSARDLPKSGSRFHVQGRLQQSERQTQRCRLLVPEKSRHANKTSTDYPEAKV